MKSRYLLLWLGFCPVTSWSMDLTEAYQRALSSDVSWQVNQMRFQIEQQNLGIAKGAILPTVGVNASLYKQYQDQDQSSNSSLDFGGQDLTFFNTDSTTRQVAVSLRQPLFRMDVWQRYKQVSISQQLAELKLQSQKQDLMLQVASKYFDVLRQESLLQIYQQEEKALLEQYRVLNAKLQEGLVAKIEVSEAQAQYQSTVAKRVAGETQYKIALEELEQFTGKINSDLAKISDEFQYQAPMPSAVDDWIEMAFRNNLNLNQSRVAHQIAKQQIKVDQAEYYPQLEAVATRAWTKQTPETMISGNGTVDKVGLELNWLPFNGTRSHIIGKSRLEADAALTEIKAVEKTVQTEIKRSFMRVETAHHQLKAYRAAMDSATLVADASKASYQEGLKTLVDVLLAQRNAFAAKQDYIHAQYDYILNVLQLRASSGLLDIEDLKELNAWLE